MKEETKNIIHKLKELYEELDDDALKSIIVFCMSELYIKDRFEES